jgi:hypothetical protein
VLAFPDKGFVFLSTPKTGSTAIEAAFAHRAAMLIRRPSSLKHMTARRFERVIAPILDEFGYPRESYELVCVIREPVDWVASWWRYLSRPAVAGQPQYTGDLTFDEFAGRVVGREIKIGNLGRFVRNAEGQEVVSTMFRYDHLDRAVAWMAERLRVDAPELEQTNVSPQRPMEISATTRARLEEHFAGQAKLYERAW